MGKESRGNTKEGCDCKTIKEEQALKIVSDILKSMFIPEAILKEIKATLKDSLEAKKNFNDSSLKLLQQRYKEIQKNLIFCSK